MVKTVLAASELGFWGEIFVFGLKMLVDIRKRAFLGVGFGLYLRVFVCICVFLRVFWGAKTFLDIEEP